VPAIARTWMTSSLRAVARRSRPWLSDRATVHILVSRQFVQSVMTTATQSFTRKVRP
jgi:hypothetical protein